MTIITVEQARNLLTNLKPGCTMEVEMLPGGMVKVYNGHNGNGTVAKTNEEIFNETYGHLAKSAITVTEAADKYKIPRSTIQSWIHRSKYLETEGSYPMTVNEAAVAYLSDIYHERKRTGSKAPLVGDDGLPYELKRPDVAEYRRRRKKQPPLAK